MKPFRLNQAHPPSFIDPADEFIKISILLSDIRVAMGMIDAIRQSSSWQFQRPGSDAFLHAFFHTCFHSFLVSVIQKGSFNTYRIPEFIIGSELGICKTGNFKIFYGFSNLWVIEQVGRNLLRVGIDFCQETEPQDHHALVSDGMWSELREFNEGEMQALDNLIAVLIVHDAVVVDEQTIPSAFPRRTSFL